MNIDEIAETADENLHLEVSIAEPGYLPREGSILDIPKIPTSTTDELEYSIREAILETPKPDETIALLLNTNIKNGFTEDYATLYTIFSGLLDPTRTLVNGYIEKCYASAITIPTYTNYIKKYEGTSMFELSDSDMIITLDKLARKIKRFGKEGNILGIKDVADKIFLLRDGKEKLIG